jgi:hypothetical protein
LLGKEPPGNQRRKQQRHENLFEHTKLLSVKKLDLYTQTRTLQKTTVIQVFHGIRLVYSVNGD